MSTVTVSPKYQVVIPRDVRDEFPIIPGQKMTWIVKGKTLKLVPLLSWDELRGIARGIDTEGYREEHEEERR